MQLSACKDSQGATPFDARQPAKCVGCQDTKTLAKLRCKQNSLYYIAHICSCCLSLRRFHCIGFVSAKQNYFLGACRLRINTYRCLRGCLSIRLSSCTSPACSRKEKETCRMGGWDHAEARRSSRPPINNMFASIVCKTQRLGEALKEKKLFN
jgi:hypothetical protein